MIRRFEARDLDEVVALSLRAWEPVFAGMRSTLPFSLADKVWPDWESEQRDAVITTCEEHASDTLVLELDGQVVGFAVVLVLEDRGKIDMIAVDPKVQRQGLAQSLMDAAEERMTSEGVCLAYIGTGGDPGHAPARRLYEANGYLAVPGMHYFKAL